MAEAKSFVSDGDLGSGEPGSLRWHKLAAAEMTAEQKVVYLIAVIDSMSDDDCFAFLLHLIEGNSDGCHGN